MLHLVIGWFILYRNDDAHVTCDNIRSSGEFRRHSRSGDNHLTLYPAVFGFTLRFFLRAFIRLYLKIRYRVEEDLPPGPKVIAVNHPTVWDAFPILAFVTSTFVHTLVEEQVWSFFVPRIIFRLGNQIVLYRSDKSQKTIEDALFVLSKGESVLIAPEGERTDPSVTVRARRGVARLALTGHATVIPVGVWISPEDIITKKVRYNYQNKKYTVDSFFPRFRSNYGLVIGKPMYLDTFFDRDLTHDEYQEISTNILERIYKLSEKAKNLFGDQKGNSQREET